MISVQSAGEKNNNLTLIYYKIITIITYWSCLLSPALNLYSKEIEVSIKMNYFVSLKWLRVLLFLQLYFCLVKLVVIIYLFSVLKASKGKNPTKIMKNYESLNSINRICYSIMRILDTGKNSFQVFVVVQIVPYTK